MGHLAAANQATLTVFLELIGLSPDRIAASLQATVEHIGGAALNEFHSGLSPHAPYTVHPELLRQAASMSRRYRFPLAMHLAETEAELELLRSGTGPLRQMLEAFGAWSPEAIALGSRPLDYLQTLAGADRALVIHGNYLDDEEIAFVAAQRARLAIVYCPRTQERFGHAPYPLAKMLGAGAVVALGTDSRASNPDLDLLAEMRHVAAHHALAPERVLELGTINGAKGIGLDAERGSLAPGKFADLTIIRLANAAARDPFDFFSNPGARVVATFHRGRDSRLI